MNHAKYFLISTLIFVSEFVMAEPDQIDGSVQHNDEKIYAALLIGFWETNDSTKHRIEFVNSGFEVLLKSISLHPYFFSKDSLNNVSSSGYFPNWPPFNCDLNLRNTDTLKIIFSQLGVRPNTYLYIRVKD